MRYHSILLYNSILYGSDVTRAHVTAVDENFTIIIITSGSCIIIATYIVALNLYTLYVHDILVVYSSYSYLLRLLSFYIHAITTNLIEYFVNA